MQINHKYFNVYVCEHNDSFVAITTEIPLLIRYVHVKRHPIGTRQLSWTSFLWCLLQQVSVRSRRNAFEEKLRKCQLLWYSNPALPATCKGPTLNTRTYTNVRISCNYFYTGYFEYNTYMCSLYLVQNAITLLIYSMSQHTGWRLFGALVCTKCTESVFGMWQDHTPYWKDACNSKYWKSHHMHKMTSAHKWWNGYLYCRSHHTSLEGLGISRNSRSILRQPSIHNVCCFSRYIREKFIAEVLSEICVLKLTTYRFGVVFEHCYVCYNTIKSSKIGSKFLISLELKVPMWILNTQSHSRLWIQRSK